MNKQQRQALNKISKWRTMSFPNGSNYRQQYLPEGNHTNVEGFGLINVEAVYNRGYRVRFYGAAYAEIEIPFARKSVGPGVNLREHFNTRDQALSVLV